MIDPQELYNRAMEAAEDWADKDHASGILEDAVSAMEGMLVAELKAKGEPVTVILKLVKNDSRWKEAAQNWRTARKEALIARLKYEQVNRFMDNVRTKESTERALAR
ncbi:MAG: hypothetical protein JRI26_11495 [Deltaproteobacteria bacterium]|nr:hypothetical protein [Deltaproteobacteria bacterium]